MHLIRRAGLFVAILTVAATVVSAGEKTRIVWDASSVGGSDVFSARGNGKRVRLRTPKTDDDAVLLGASPNGRRIAWLLDPPGTERKNDLVVARARGGRGRTATADLEGYTVAAKFTGDSKHLVFLHEGATTGRTMLYRTNARGKGLRNLTADVPGSAVSPMSVSAFGAEVLVNWKVSEHLDLVYVDVKRAVPTILGPGLPAGAPGDLAMFQSPGDHAWFSAPGVLYFTWRPEGATRDDLWQFDRAGGLTLRASAIDSAHAVTGGMVVLDGPDLVLVTPGGETAWTAPEKILDFGRGFAEEGPVVAVAGRVLLLPGSGEPTDLLPGREIEEVEVIRMLPGGLGWLVVTQEAGRRRLLQVRPGEEPIDLAAGHAGRVGASYNVGADGTLIWARLAEVGNLGDLVVRDLESGEETTLLDRLGLVAIPGGASFSRKSGDVLFTAVTQPFGEKALFLWGRKADVITTLDPGNKRPRSYLFTR